MITIHQQDFIAANLYSNETELWQDALRSLLQTRPDLRIALAVYRYQTDETLTLAKAASIANVSYEQMRELLHQRGIALRLGPATIAELQAEVNAMEAYVSSD